MSKRGSGKRRQRTWAERTTKAQGGVVHLDMSRTFLLGGMFVETMVDPRDGEGLVRVDAEGMWSSHVKALPDEPVLLLAAQQAREFGQLLVEAADAAEGDGKAYRARTAKGEES